MSFGPTRAAAVSRTIVVTLHRGTYPNTTQLRDSLHRLLSPVPPRQIPSLSPLQAFVGVLMVLLACAGVFLRASSEGGSGVAGGAEDGGNDKGEGRGLPGTVPPPLGLFSAAFSALLALTTVG